MANDVDRTACEQQIRTLLSAITLNDLCLAGPGDLALETIGLDSIGMIDLVYGLEDRFAITIDDEDVVPANFGTIAALTALVERKCR
jgi:acyl carrier protein